MTQHDAEQAGEIGAKQILIIDDEVLVRETGKAMLEMFGYAVQTAAHAEQAFELLRHNPKGFDLVMIDLNMPDMQGDECFRALKKAYPAIRAVIISGSLTCNSRIQKLIPEGLLGTIQKPFSMNALEKAVESLLTHP